MAQRLISASCDSLCVFKTFARVTAESHLAQGSKQNRLSSVVCSQNPQREHNIFTFITRAHSYARDKDGREDRRGTPTWTGLVRILARAGTPVKKTSSVTLAGAMDASD